MTPLRLHDWHALRHASFLEVHDMEMVGSYRMGSETDEYRCLTQTAAVLDLSARGRLCVLGPDRHSFLNGQVTNNVKDLPPNHGCHAFIVNHKARVQSDLFIHRLSDELLLDLEPGLGAPTQQRLEKYLIAEDATLVDASPHYGLWSVLGPQAAQVLRALNLAAPLPDQPLTLTTSNAIPGGEIYIVCQPRAARAGFDLYVPQDAMADVGERLTAAVQSINGGLAGWTAYETLRIESGQPRYGQDIDETNLAPETGLENTAIDYRKGCYIGQEVIARIRTYGQVARALRGLRLADPTHPSLPAHGDRLWHQNKDVGHITSAVRSPSARCTVALGYIRRECNAIGTRLTLRTAQGDTPVDVVKLPLEESR